MGGVVLVGVMLMSVVSIVGRSLLRSPIQGDFELVQLSLAVAVAAFLPYCQMRRANIIVDFFTARLNPRTQSALDSGGAMLLALTMALVAWRVGAGAVVIKANNESTMILGLPIWIAYALMAPAFALTSLIGLHGATADWKKGHA